MRLSNSNLHTAAALVACLLGGSACLASPPGHTTPSKHPHKSPHAGFSQSAVAPIAIQSVPLPVELAGHGSFIMAMCTDHTGRIWLGTEEQGVFEYDQRQPYKSRWHHWTTADGLGDNTCYCLCVDSKNRVFAGSNNSGCSVFNGTSGWRSYSQLTGPLGAHLYAMAVSPVTGSVFMATEAGIAVYNEKGDAWSYLLAPRGRSLPTATSLAFNKAGDLILGSQTGGIYIGRAASSFQHWDHIPGPEFMPRSASGPGLPSGDINCLLTVSGGNVIWAGTRCGVAVSVDSGNHWGYFRGADFADKVNGLYSGKGYDATLCGLELLTTAQYQKFYAAPNTAGAKTSAAPAPQADVPKTGAVPNSWIALDAADDPTDQMGVHITVTGGTTSKSQANIDTSKTVHPVPAALYRDEREGNFTYTFQGLSPSTTYMIRFSLCELDYFGVGERQFLVTANGSPALPPMDVFEKTGGCDIALTQDVPVKTNAYGVLVLAFAGLRQQVSEPPAPAPAANQMLSQDYVTSLAQGADGRVYIGHWQGLESYNPATQSFQPEGQLAAPGGQTAGFVSSLLPLQYGGVLVGGYGNGLSYAGLNSSSFQHQPSPTTFLTLRTAELPFPSPAKPPTTQKLQELAAELAKSGQPNMKPGDGAYLGTDWATRGNWIGRLGQKYAVMFAADSPLNHYFINDFDYSADGDLGPNRVPNDSVRRWIHWMRSQDSRVMSDPVIGTRRESEYDDHGEDYDMRIEGPDLWITVQVPAGVHRLSAYFMNKDGGSRGSSSKSVSVSVEVIGGPASGDTSDVRWYGDGSSSAVTISAASGEPSDVTYQWSASGPITIQGSQTGSSVSVMPTAGSTGQNDATVTVTYTAGSATTTGSKSFTVRKPSTTIQSSTDTSTYQAIYYPGGAAYFDVVGFVGYKVQWKLLDQFGQGINVPTVNEHADTVTQDPSNNSWYSGGTWNPWVADSWSTNSQGLYDHLDPYASTANGRSNGTDDGSIPADNVLSDWKFTTGSRAIGHFYHNFVAMGINTTPFMLNTYTSSGVTFY